MTAYPFSLKDISANDPRYYQPPFARTNFHLVSPPITEVFTTPSRDANSPDMLAKSASNWRSTGTLIRFPIRASVLVVHSMPPRKSEFCIRYRYGWACGTNEMSLLVPCTHDLSLALVLLPLNLFPQGSHNRRPS